MVQTEFMKERSTTKLPYVTVIIVTRNEEKYIEQCLQSFLDQDYPKDCYEILIVDGESTDNTIEFANSVLDKYYRKNDINQPSIRFINNEKLILAAGWNKGIVAAKGIFVTRIDAHGYAERDFISASVGTMLEIGDAVCVGGKVISKANGKTGRLVSKILSSPFGVGNSCFRVSNRAHYSDTVAFGLYKKSVFEDVGYFDESLKRNQDNDLHARIKRSGGKFYFNPEILSVYYTRESVRGMLQQGYLNGLWNVVVFRKNRKSLALRHITPFLFVSGLAFTSIAGQFYTFFLYIGLGALILHFLLGFTFALKKTKRIQELFVIPLLFFSLHIAYGIGTYLGIFKIFKSSQKHRKTNL